MMRFNVDIVSLAFVSGVIASVLFPIGAAYASLLSLRVFEIRPAAMKVEAKSILTDAALEEAMKSRADELRKEAEKDAEMERNTIERKGTSSDVDLRVV